MSLTSKSAEYLFQQLVEENFSYQINNIFKKNQVTLKEVIEINKKKKFDKLLINKFFNFFDKEEDFFYFLENFLKSFPKKDIKSFEIYKVNHKKKNLENKYSFNGNQELNKKDCSKILIKNTPNHIIDEFFYDVCKLNRRVSFFIYSNKEKIEIVFFYNGEKEYGDFLIDFLLLYYKSNN